VSAAAIVFAAAPLRPTPRLKTRLAPVAAGAFVVAADDGATTALAFGLRPDVVIGDLDSVSAATLSELRATRIPIETYPRAKDATDGQLAVERALQSSPRELWLLGFLGGPRLDQALANVFLLARVDVRAILLDEHNEAVLLRRGESHTWQPEPYETISLIPLSRHAGGVRASGLRWTLDGVRLERGDTRGISNEPDPGAREARVSVDSGLLLVTRHFSPSPSGFLQG
jgi:thiamine pyrophosphokinase